MTDAAALEVMGIHKTYRGGLRRRLPVLSDLDLRVERGEVFGLLGKNGAGKSTTFRLLMGLAWPDAGEIRLLGGAPGARDVLARVGYCPENPQLPPNLKVIELLRDHSILVADRILGPRNRIEWVLGELDLLAVRSRPVRTLSRGTVQRLALALTLLARPDLLILDEPLTALDPQARHRVIKLLRDLKAQGTTMVIASHILAELEGLADRYGILNSGRIVREVSNELPAKDGEAALEIAIPFERARELVADEPDLVGIRQGSVQCFPGLPFAKAQDLVQRWSAAGVPILSVRQGLSRIEEEILLDFDHIDSAAATLAEERQGEPV